VLSSTSLAPSARNLPFLAKALNEKQTDLAFVGPIIFTAAVVAYLLT
jgi:hypothetical protein